MNDALKDIAKQIEEKPELKDKLNQLADTEMSLDDYISICKEYGIEISKEDLESQNEISDDELTSVTGGAYQTIDIDKGQSVSCDCVMGGGGAGVIINGQKFSPCACVMGGGGEQTVIREINGYYVGLASWCVGFGFSIR